MPKLIFSGTMVGGNELTSPSVFRAVVMAQSTGNMEMRDASTSMM